MGDYTIRMRFHIDADEAAVREALTTTEGIAAWWSDSVDGTPEKSGGDLRVHFPDLPQPFEFDVDHDDRQITWMVGGFPPWWLDTAIRWSLEPAEEPGATVLHFAHSGFDPEADVIPVITPAWAGIINRLKQYAETGKVDPFAMNR